MSPRVQSNIYPKLKTPQVGAIIFWDIGTQLHVQKQTKIKMNNIDGPKLGGGTSEFNNSNIIFFFQFLVVPQKKIMMILGSRVKRLVKVPTFYQD